MSFKITGGFYRHLYEQKLGPVKNQDINPSINKHSNKDDIESKSKTKINRNYRKRKLSTEQNLDLSEGEIVSDEEINRLNLEDIKAAKKSQKGMNIDEDSDFSVNDPSDSENDIDKNDSEIKKDSIPKDEIDERKQTVEDKVEDSKKETETMPKVDIWKKRTVGLLFDEAVKRYYERKAAKSA